MRILIVTDAWSPQINGVVFTLQQTRRHLEALGHAVEVLHPGLFRNLPCPGYREIRLALDAGRRLPELAQAFAPDALHIATEGPLGMAARRYALRTGMPFTTAYHTRFPEYLHARTRFPQNWTYAYLRRFHQAATRTMVPTAGVRQDLLDNGFDPEKVVLWSRGVDLSVFTPDATRPPTTPVFLPSGRSQGIASATGEPWGIFLYAGRVSVEKNLEAFLKLDLPGEKWVAGDGPALAALKQRYPDVHFLGALTHAELAQHYRRASVFVFPSLTDTFGLVLLEAMACGCPIAALPASSTRDVLGGSGAGVIDADLRAACLAALRIPRELPARYAQGFSWANTTQTFLRHLQPIA